MSKMLDSVVEDITDLYYDGMKPATIAATLKISIKFVMDVISELEETDNNE